MNEFEQKVAEVVSRKLNDGTVEKLIEAKIEEAVKKSLDDLFSYSGEGKSLLDKKVKEVVVPVIENHNFNDYLLKLDTILTEIINHTQLSDNKTILKNFKALMTDADSIKVVSLSEIFDKYRDHVASHVNTSNLEKYCDDAEPYYEHVSASVEVEKNDDYYSRTSRFDRCYLIFKCEEDESLNFEFELFKSKSEDTWTIMRRAAKIDLLSLRYLSEFEIFLSLLERSYSHIRIDTEYDCDDDIEPEEKPEWSLT